MLFARALTPFLLIFSLFTISCVEDKDYGEANNLRPESETNINANLPVNEKPAEDSTQKLETLINIPVEAEETDFRVDDVKAVSDDGDDSGPKGKMLTVVLNYSDENAEKLEKLLSKSQQFDIEIGAELWFPAELKAKADAEGDQKIKGKGYSADDFAKKPYLKGTILRIPQTNFFVLRMSNN